MLHVDFVIVLIAYLFFVLIDVSIKLGNIKSDKNFPIKKFQSNYISIVPKIEPFSIEFLFWDFFLKNIVISLSLTMIRDEEIGFEKKWMLLLYLW